VIAVVGEALVDLVACADGAITATPGDVEPMATAVERIILDVSDDVLVLVDLNCRPNAVGDRDRYGDTATSADGPHRGQSLDRGTDPTER
jgi:hypothetical protein